MGSGTLFYNEDLERQKKQKELLEDNFRARLRYLLSEYKHYRNSDLLSNNMAFEEWVQFPCPWLKKND